MQLCCFLVYIVFSVANHILTILYHKYFYSNESVTNSTTTSSLLLYIHSTIMNIIIRVN